MDSYYLDGDVGEALTERGSSKTITSRRPLARVSLMMSHMERCYAEEVVNKEKQEILALEIYRTLLTNNQQITEGILKAITMAYQDMFRVRDSDQGRVMHCMCRIPTFRFRRSLSISNLR